MLIRLRRKLAKWLRKDEWFWDGRLSVATDVAVVNFIFQRVFRINSDCRFPVHFTSRVTHPERLSLGRGVVTYLAVSGGVYIQALNGVRIGDDVMIAPGVKVISANHTKGTTNRWDPADPITIGDRVWIGSNAVVLPGVSVGDDAVIGAGAVVISDVAAGSTVVGVPARPTGRRCEPVVLGESCAMENPL